MTVEYFADALHKLNIIDKKLVCRPYSTYIQSAYLPAGTRRDVDVSEMLAALGEHPEQCGSLDVVTALFSGMALPIDEAGEEGPPKES